MHNTESAKSPEPPLDIKCCSCYRSIQSSDWVRQAKPNVYHLACFSCNICKRQLSTGEEFALSEDRILCKLHYVEQLELPPSLSESQVVHIPPHTPRVTTELSPISVDNDNNWNKPRNKRMRTSFSEEQVQVLQANFEVDANPDSAELERIAADVSLPKRVTQVWFQNSRARQKKQQQQQQQKMMDK